MKDGAKTHSTTRILFDVLRYLLMLIVVGGLVWYVYRNWSAFIAVLDASRSHIYVLIVLVCFSILVNGIQAQILLNTLGVKIGFWENQAVTVAAVLCNYVPFRAGTIIRMNYLKRVYGFDYVRFGALGSMRFLTLLASSTLLGCVGLIGSWFQQRVVSSALWAVLIGGFVISCVLLLSRSPSLSGSRSGNVAGLWSRFYRDYRNMQAHSGTLAALLFLSGIQCVIFSIRLLVAYDSIRVTLSYWAALILAPSVSILSFATLTPGNLGIREWVLGLLSFSTGYDFRNGIFAGTLDRAIAAGCAFVFGGTALIYLWSKTRKTLTGRRPDVQERSTSPGSCGE